MKARELAELLMTQPDLEVFSLALYEDTPKWKPLKPEVREMVQTVDPTVYEADCFLGEILIRRFAVTPFRAWIFPGLRPPVERVEGE